MKAKELKIYTWVDDTGRRVYGCTVETPSSTVQVDAYTLKQLLIKLDAALAIQV